MTIEDLTALNQRTVERLQARSDFLQSKQDGLPTEDQFVVMANVSDLQTRIRTLEFTRIHLKASKIVVAFDAAEIAKLAKLEATLDATILQDATVNAVLASLPAVMTAAVKIDAAINSHIAKTA